MLSAPASSVRRAIEQDARVGLLLLQGLSSRILQTETMIETLTHRDMSSRLVSSCSCFAVTLACPPARASPLT